MNIENVLPGHGVLLGLGMLTLNESNGWLTARGRRGEARESLKWMRANDSEGTRAEMEEIRAGVEFEARAKEPGRLQDFG